MPLYFPFGTASSFGEQQARPEATVDTTDDTVTTLDTITLATDTRILITALVKATRTGGTAGASGDVGGYVLYCFAQNIGGTAEIIGQSAGLTAEDQAAWNANFDESGATIRLRVTGAIDNNITWVAQVYTY